MPRGWSGWMLSALLASGVQSAVCQKKIARPPVEEVPMRDASETAPPPAQSGAVAAKPGKDKPDKSDKSDKSHKTDRPAFDKPDPALSAPAMTPTSDDSSEPPRDRAFPKQADACKKDEDCAATNLALGGEFTCCTPCRPVAGTRAWIKRVEQVCQQKSKVSKPRCAPWDCSRPEAECRAGKCSVK